MRGGRKRVEAIEKESKRAKSAQIQNCRTFPSSAAAFAPYLLRASYEDKRMLSSGRSGGRTKGMRAREDMELTKRFRSLPTNACFSAFFFRPKQKQKQCATSCRVKLVERTRTDGTSKLLRLEGPIRPLLWSSRLHLLSPPELLGPKFSTPPRRFFCKKIMMRQELKLRTSSAAAEARGLESSSSNVHLRRRRPRSSGEFFRHRHLTLNISSLPPPRSLPPQEAVTAAGEKKTALILLIQSICDSMREEDRERTIWGEESINLFVL